MKNIILLILALSVILNAYLGYEYIQCKDGNGSPLVPPPALNAICAENNPNTTDIDLKLGIDSIKGRLGYLKGTENQHYGIINISDLNKIIATNSLNNDVLLIYPVWNAVSAGGIAHERVILRFAKSTVSTTNCKDFSLSYSKTFYTPSWCPELCPK